MEKPVYFDGSIMPKCGEAAVKIDNVMTDDVRKSVSGNPFVVGVKEEMRERSVLI